MDYTIIITLLSIIGTIANIYKKKWCFVVWIFTNLFWCIYDFYKGIYSQSALFLFYTIFAIWGLYKWSHEK